MKIAYLAGISIWLIVVPFKNLEIVYNIHFNNSKRNERESRMDNRINKKQSR